MTIHANQRITISCDGCPEAEESEFHETFQEMWKRLKESGWIVFKIEDEWKHRCPSCAEEE